MKVSVMSRMSTIKRLICCIVAAVLSITLCSCSESNNDSSYYGDVSESVTESSTNNMDEESDIDSKKKDIEIVFKDYINSNTVKGVALEHSYYYNLLNDTEKIAYDELVNGMIMYREYITLSASITEDELIHIMNIIMTNCPEIFHVDFKYSYDLNVSGYINNFYPEYNLPYSIYKTSKENFENNRINYCQKKQVTEYDFVSNIYNSLRREVSIDPISVTNLKKESDFSGYYSQTIYGEDKSSLGAAKYIQYYCNYMGIENLIVIGEVLNSSKYSFDSLNPKTEFKKEENDGIYTITMDINNYHAWNIIKIAGIWVNCDAVFDAYANEKYGATENSFFAVPDEIIRQTRLLQINNDMLGLSPSCYSNNFHSNARKMNYIKDYSEEEVSYCVDAMVDSLYYNKPSSIAIQFQTEANYLQFQNEFDNAMIEFNKEHNQKIPKYKIKAEDYDLVIKIYDILYS